MGWVLPLLLLSLASSPALTFPFNEDASLEEQADMRDLLTSMFIENHREGREMGEEEEEDLSNLVAEEEEEEEEEEAVEAVSDPQEIARFNNYMDAIYRRMNAALRAKLMDPMVLNMNAKVIKNEVEDKKNKRNKREALEEDEDEDEEEMEKEMAEEEEEEEAEVEVDRMGLSERKGKKNKEKRVKKNKGKKGKKGKKNKNVEDGKEEKKNMSPEKVAKRAERKAARLVKKKAAKAAKAAKKEEEMSRQKRSKKNGNKGKVNGAKHNGNKGKANGAKNKNADKESRALNKKGKGKGKGKSKVNGAKRNGNKGKSGKGKKGKGNNNGKAREDKQADAKSMGSLAGIATLRREGDVEVKDESSHKTVTSSFTVGPLQLEVSKTYGHGKERTVRTAKASTDVMTGTMILKVKPDGSAHVKKVVFQKPEQVDVLGSISDQKKRSDSYLKNSVSKMRPIAAQKILKTARYVLKAPSTKQ